MDKTGCVPLVCIGHSMSYPGNVHKFLPQGSRGYNCWGRVLNKITGEFINDNPRSYDRDSCNLTNLANWTVEGVQAAGAETGEILGVLGDSEINGIINNLNRNQYLIAMRVNNEGAYHYMRYDNNAWTHKYGGSGMLYRLDNITPNDDRAWAIYNGNPFTGKVTIPLNEEGEQVYCQPYTSKTWYIKVTLPMNDSCCILI